MSIFHRTYAALTQLLAHKLLSKPRELLKLAKQDNCKKVRKKKEQYDQR